jgi:hypothetical protein
LKSNVHLKFTFKSQLSRTRNIKIPELQCCSKGNASFQRRRRRSRTISQCTFLRQKACAYNCLTYDDPWPRSKKASSNTSLQLFTAIHSFISCMINVRKKKEEKTRGNTHTRKEGFVLILHRDKKTAYESMWQPGRRPKEWLE